MIRPCAICGMLDRHADFCPVPSRRPSAVLGTAVAALAGLAVTCLVVRAVYVLFGLVSR